MLKWKVLEDDKLGMQGMQGMQGWKMLEECITNAVE
jgi:hypothetical protein